MRYYYLCLTFLVLAGLPSLYAGQVKGRVTDKGAEPLPFATVFIQGTTTGVNANAHGEYQLSLGPGQYKLVCRYIGFMQSEFSCTIRGDEAVHHDFVLAEQSLQMKEVVVRSSDEDPAYRIIRQAIKKRNYHLKQVQSFQTGIYLKGVLRTSNVPEKVLGMQINKSDLGVDSSGKGIIYLCEEIADYYSQGGKEKTVIHSVKESGSPNGFGFAQLPPVITFYENNVQLFSRLNPRGFVSPVSDNAIGFYRYRLLGEFSENNYVVYKIEVTPRRSFEPLFSGIIYIVNDDYAIHSLDLMLTGRSNMEMLDTLKIAQLYIPLRRDEWVIKSQVLYPVCNILGFGFAGNFVTVYNNQQVNQPIPDSVFNRNIVSVYDDAANKKDTAYWNSSRPLQLEEDETRDYVLKDSIRMRLEDPRYIDSVRRRENKISISELVYEGVRLNGREYRQHWRSNALLTMVNYNTVEGLNLAPKLWWSYTWDTAHTVNARAALRYGFANTHFNAMGGLSYTHTDRAWQGRYWTVTAEGGQYVFQFNPANPIRPVFNTVSSLLFGENHMKIYERKEGNLRLEMNGGNGLQWSIKGSYQQRLPLGNTTDFTWGPARYSENTPGVMTGAAWAPHQAFVTTLNVSYQPGYTYTIYPDHKTSHPGRLPVFSLMYQKGIPGIGGSVTDFDKWRFSIRDDMRLKLMGSLSYHIAAGGFLNRRYVSIPDLMHLNGNRIIIAGPALQSFQLAPYYTFSNTASLYGEAHVEYYLKGLLTNKLPLLKQAHWYLLFGSNAFYADDNLYYVEAFTGLDNLGYKQIRLFRVDFVYSWDSFKQNSYGFRIAVPANGVIRRRTDDTNGEW